jgi:KDO2-lipid IV(A) lauroyltransferase
VYFVLKCLASVIGSMSDKALDRTVGFITFLFFDVLRARRALIIKNLKIAFADTKSIDELVRIGRSSVYNFVMTAFEFFRGYKTDIAADIRVEGEEHLKAALAQKKGVYILCFHMGNWEAMGAACTRRYGPSYVLVKKVGSPNVDRFVSELREKQGFLSIKRRKKGDGYQGIKDALSRNEIIGFVMDQARPGEPKLPFFGKPAKTNTSFAAIWRRNPVPIIPAYINRTGVSKHVLRFFPEIHPVITDDTEKDIIEHSLMFNQVVETHVRTSPEHYFWMHNRWK